MSYCRKWGNKMTDISRLLGQCSGFVSIWTRAFGHVPQKQVLRDEVQCFQEIASVFHLTCYKDSTISMIHITITMKMTKTQ